MVLITVGSTRNDFSRLLREADLLAENGVLRDVFAQIGLTAYTPRNYRFRQFMNRQEFLEKIFESDFVISHAGTGTVNLCLGMKKKLIIVPRRKSFGEHPDDHQIELAEYLSSRNRALCVDDIENDLKSAVLKIPDWTPSFRTDSSERLLFNELDAYLRESIFNVKPAMLHNQE